MAEGACRSQDLVSAKDTSRYILGEHIISPSFRHGVLLFDA